MRHQVEVQQGKPMLKLSGDSPLDKFAFRQTTINENGHNFWHVYEYSDVYLSCVSVVSMFSKPPSHKISIKWSEAIAEKDHSFFFYS